MYDFDAATVASAFSSAATKSFVAVSFFSWGMLLSGWPLVVCVFACACVSGSLGVWIVTFAVRLVLCVCVLCGLHVHVHVMQSTSHVTCHVICGCRFYISHEPESHSMQHSIPSIDISHSVSMTSLVDQFNAAAMDEQPGIKRVSSQSQTQSQ